VDYVYVDNFFAPDFVVSEVGTYGDVESQQNLHYINVPILANIYLTEGLSLQLGPQIGFLLNGTARFDPSDEQLAGLITDYDDQINITDRLNNISLAAAAGLQYELPSSLTLGLRYNFGFTDVVDDTED
jgi:opacity protein-like surface antigen